MLKSNFTGYIRKQNAPPKQCCVGIEKQHALCNCYIKKEITWCKNTCDSDTNCKGFSQSIGGGRSIEEGGKINIVTCHLATTSNCKGIHRSCSGYAPFSENDGPLDPNASCGNSGWAGCYVKQ